MSNLPKDATSFAANAAHDTSPRVFQNLAADLTWCANFDAFMKQPENGRGRRPLIDPLELLRLHTHCQSGARRFSDTEKSAFGFREDGKYFSDRQFITAVNALLSAAIEGQPSKFEKYDVAQMTSGNTERPGNIKKYFELVVFGTWLLELRADGAIERRGRSIDDKDILRLAAAMFAALEVKQKAERVERGDAKRRALISSRRSPTDAQASNDKRERQPPLPKSITRTELRNAWAIMFGSYPSTDALKNRVPAAQARCRDFLSWWDAGTPAEHNSGGARCRGIERIADERLFESRPPPKRKYTRRQVSRAVTS